MNYENLIERVFENIENDRVDNAVVTCLRIARHLQDFLYTAIFLREMYPNKSEFSRIIYDDIHHLNKEAQGFVFEKSLEAWLDTRTTDISIGYNEQGEKRNVLTANIAEIDSEIQQWEATISGFRTPAGMNEYDIAAFTDQHEKEKAEIRLRIKALQIIKQNVKTRCVNYAIRIEKQLNAQNKSRDFLSQVQTSVNNYFKAHSDDVYAKLQKAAEFVDSSDPEDYSMLLTQVRRAIHASADFFYPPKEGQILCSDGKKRQLGNEQYLNRLSEYLMLTFPRSSSSSLLKAEFEYLSIFVRRLNDTASKGVHSDVSAIEAKQGVIGLYMFLYNIISKLEFSNNSSHQNYQNDVSECA